MATMTDLPIRIQVKILRLGDGCWYWTGQVNKGGYGRVRDDAANGSRTVQAHRYVYEHLVGEIAEGLTLDHLCRRRRCVNPEHLDPCTIGENVHRSERTAASTNAAKTHCAHGHEFTADNTRLDADGHRVCRTCRRINALARYHARSKS